MINERSHAKLRAYEAWLRGEGPHPFKVETPTPKRRRQRRPTLKGVARQAAKAGISVASYKVRADGIDIVVHVPASDISKDNTTTNPWDKVLNDAAD